MKYRAMARISPHAVLVRTDVNATASLSSSRLPQIRLLGTTASIFSATTGHYPDGRKKKATAMMA